jgi:hypothetical protein
MSQAPELLDGMGLQLLICAALQVSDNNKNKRATHWIQYDSQGTASRSAALCVRMRDSAAGTGDE